MTFNVDNPLYLLKLMRPSQWIKNGFVFVGLIFSKGWSEPDTLRRVIWASLAFCATASAIYILNDIEDISKDRRHPVKCRRPLASGKVTMHWAWGTMIINLVCGLFLGFCVSTSALFILICYILINLLYSKKLKEIPILDVFIIASGFLLRILIGTIGVSIQPSDWLLLCGMMISLFIGFGKRRAELLNMGGETAVTRNVLEFYSERLLDIFIAITGGGCIIFYALYTVDPSTVKLHHTHAFIYTIPLVIYGIFRYLYNLYRQEGEECPVEELIYDKQIIATVVLWAVMVVLIIM
jgi:4-hydroxybenzoate polyprenyltransferase